MSNFGTYNVSAMTRRILKLHDAATPEQRLAGTAWYTEARVFCSKLASETGYSLDQVARVTAALSPQVSWEGNKRAVIDALSSHAHGTEFVYTGYRANADKAERILAGDIDALKGPKVTAFYQAIVGDLSACVVDIWICRAARSKQETTARVFADDEMPGTREHRAIAEAVRRAAVRRDIEPAVMQATAWVACRSSGVWVKPQTMPAPDRHRFWQRQARARKVLGIRPVPYSYTGHSAGKVAALTGAA